MALIEMREIWTPLKLIGIKFFKTRNKEYYIKLWSRPRKRIFN
jgi:hypothetical protein